jgi:hypothetical protein
MKILHNLKHAFILILSILPLFAISQTQTKQFTFEEYIKKQVNEQVYMHTDRDVYAPGDTIWFKAYIRNKMSLKKTHLSQLFYVFLVSKDFVLRWEKYLIEDSQSKGYFTIKDSDAEGTYYLVALSSWMNNYEPDCFFRKKIMIRNNFGKNQKYTPFFNKHNYFPGDTVKIRMEYLNRLKHVEKDKNLEYLFKAGNKTDYIIKPYKTDVSNTIKWGIPITETKKYKLKITNYEDLDKTVEIPVTRQIKINFYPEGGNCVNELINNIAFKATYENGYPANISGNIINEKGKIVVKTKTEHDGMGKFIFSPQKGEKYYFKINTNEQLNGKYEIPAANDSGWVLNARVSHQKLIIGIRNSFSHVDTCYLALSIHGILYTYKKIIVNSQTISTIPTTNLPGGIGVLTLLDHSHHPIAERLVFVNYNSFITADIIPSKEKSLKMDSMVVKIKMNSELDFLTDGQYSLSVYDDQLGSSEEINEANIIASTYFNNELNGYVNNPNYYFTPDNKMAQQLLDLLLMVQGWRRYRYIKNVNDYVLQNDPISQDIICGKLEKNKFGKLPEGIPGEVNLYFAGNSKKLAVEKNGEFCFYPEYEKNKCSFIMISGKDFKGNSNVNIITNTNRFYSNLKEYLNENPLDINNAIPFIYTYKDINDQFTVNLDNNIWIEEVKVIRTIGHIDIEQKNVESMSYYKFARNDILKTSLSIEDLIMNMGYYCKEAMSEEGIILSTYYQGKLTPIEFYVNGFNYEYDWVKLILPESIEYFYIAKGIDVKNLYGSFVVAIIKTSREKYLNSPVKGVNNSLTIPGPQLYKEFYHPKYNQKEREDKSILDLRKTIYWNPNIKVDGNGEASVVFYNAKRITKIKCVLQGMTDEGILVYGEAFYKVTREQEVDY